MVKTFLKFWHQLAQEVDSLGLVHSRNLFLEAVLNLSTNELALPVAWRFYRQLNLTGLLSQILGYTLSFIRRDDASQSLWVENTQWNFKLLIEVWFIVDVLAICKF